MPLPAFTETGDLPQGVHQASLREALERLASATLQRKVVGMRLARVFDLANTTGHVARFSILAPS